MEYKHTKEKVRKTALTSTLNLRPSARSGFWSQEWAWKGIVLLYYELCEKTWGGGPATRQISCALESHQSEPTPNKSTSEDEEDAETPEKRSDSETVSRRRSYLNDKLSSYKQNKPKRKLPMEAQVMDCMKDDLEIKKRIIEQMERSDEEHSKLMTNMAEHMEKLTSSISSEYCILLQNRAQ
jgi:hypothetical protein